MAAHLAIDADPATNCSKSTCICNKRLRAADRYPTTDDALWLELMDFLMIGQLATCKCGGNTARLSQKLKFKVGWVEERNPTFIIVCWVSLSLYLTYHFP